jgi:hypothetical protein
MKKFLIATFTLGSLIGAYAQVGVSEGDIHIDAYYGVSAFGNRLTGSINNSENFKASSIGPLGGRVEYMISDKLGIGVDFIYKNSNFSWFQTDSATAISEAHKLTTTRLRPQLRFNLHMPSSNESLDTYFGFGIGLNIRKANYLINGVSQTSDLPLPNFALIPFSARAAFGIRYFFIPNLGANVEIGIGGPIISGGLTVKI